jgi:hypothetical protein
MFRYVCSIKDLLYVLLVGGIAEMAVLEPPIGPNDKGKDPRAAIKEHATSVLKIMQHHTNTGLDANPRYRKAVLQEFGFHDTITNSELFQLSIS